MRKLFKKLLIIDGSYLLHRVLHVQSIYDLRNTITGERTGGVFKALQCIYSEIRNLDYYPVAVWDAGLSKRRLQAYPDYKCNSSSQAEVTAMVNEDTEDVDEYIYEYRKQRKELIEILDALGIPSLKFFGWEGDDLVTLLCRMSSDSIVLTDDGDHIQLLSDEVSLTRPLHGEFIARNQEVLKQVAACKHVQLPSDKFMTYQDYAKKDGFDSIRQYVLCKAIIGDGSDNVPQLVPKLGWVKACEISKIILDNPDNYLDKVLEKGKWYHEEFVKAHDKFLINMELVDLSKVDNDCDDQLERSIEAEITRGLNHCDYFKAVKLIGEKAIKDFDIDSTIAKVRAVAMNVMIK